MKNYKVQFNNIVENEISTTNEEVGYYDDEDEYKVFSTFNEARKEMIEILINRKREFTERLSEYRKMRVGDLRN
jgi:hypothetical protein